MASPIPSNIGRNSATHQIAAGVPELSISRKHGNLGTFLASPGIKTIGMMVTEVPGKMQPVKALVGSDLDIAWQHTVLLEGAFERVSINVKSKAIFFIFERVK